MKLARKSASHFPMPKPAKRAGRNDSYGRALPDGAIVVIGIGVFLHRWESPQVRPNTGLKVFIVQSLLPFPFHATHLMSPHQPRSQYVVNSQSSEISSPS